MGGFFSTHPEKKARRRKETTNLPKKAQKDLGDQKKHACSQSSYHVEPRHADVPVPTSSKSEGRKAWQEYPAAGFVDSIPPGRPSTPFQVLLVGSNFQNPHLTFPKGGEEIQPSRRRSRKMVQKRAKNGWLPAPWVHTVHPSGASSTPRQTSEAMRQRCWQPPHEPDLARLGRLSFPGNPTDARREHEV